MYYQNRLIEISVGLFMLLAIAALTMLALKVSGLTHQGVGQYYQLTAEFDNIGGLKVRAPVTLAGVTIGRVTRIALDKDSYKAKVTLILNREDQGLPADTSASILTQGLLGANYIALTPGFEDAHLKDGDTIVRTQSALILEKLIGQFLFSLKSDKSSNDKSNNDKTVKNLSNKKNSSSEVSFNNVANKSSNEMSNDSSAKHSADGSYKKQSTAGSNSIDRSIDKAIDDQMNEELKEDRR